MAQEHKPHDNGEATFSGADLAHELETLGAAVNKTETENLSFEDLITAGNFDWVDSRFTKPEDDSSAWTGKGDHVRGRLELMRMGREWRRGYNSVAAKVTAEEVPGRRAANAYELLYYVSHGWNGTDTVIAPGSYRADYAERQTYIPAIQGGRTRNLLCPWALETLERQDLVLCAYEDEDQPSETMTGS